MSKRSSRGVPPFMLGGLGKDHGIGDDSPDINIGAMVVISVQTEAGTSSYDVVPGVMPKKFRYHWAHVVLTAAPGSGDKFIVNNGSNAITDNMAVAGYSDGDQISFSTVEDAYMDIGKDGTLNVTTESGAVGLVTIYGSWVE